jgi:signal transduction histidine kinase
MILKNEISFRLITQKVIIVLVFVFNGFISLSQDVQHLKNDRLYLNYHILESEFSEGDYIQGNLLENGFDEYNNKEIPMIRFANNRMITLRSDVIIDSIFNEKDLFLVVLPVDYPCNIYLNGKLICKRGNYKDPYTNRIHYSESIYLPKDIIQYNKTNEIAFQLYPMEGETNPFNKSFITNAKDASKYVFKRNFFGKKLITGLLFCCFVFFVFYLVTYISRQEYKNMPYLFFALMNLFFIVSMINNVISYNFVNTFVIEFITRIGFQGAMIVCLFFLFDYTGVLKEKNKLIKIIILIIYIPAILLVVFQRNTFDLLKVNNTYPIIVLLLGNISFIVISFFYLRREKDLKSLVLFIVFVVNMLAGMHDSFYFAFLQTKPYALFTPYSVFLMNLVIFFILSVDNTKMYHLAFLKSNELKALNENLELRVQERTQKIIDYTTNLENTNKTKDKFFSIIAHDLKNPFNSIIGYSEILKTELKELSDEEIREDINILYSTSKKGYVLLDNLLQWAQTQTNQITFNPKKIHLKKITQSCIDGVENQSRFKEIEIINKVPETLDINADENLLNTILRNLLSNAVKYTSRKGLIIVKAEINGDMIEVSIKDTGIGISDKEIKDLFLIEKMHSKLGTNNERGSGLGLIICKEFVEKHGGTMVVNSEEGFGSEFKFSIPIKQS